MKVFRINYRKLSYHLNSRNLSYSQLAAKLQVSYQPTPKTVETIRRGRVPKRWRIPVADLIGVPATELYNGSDIKPNHLSAVQNAQLATLRLPHRIQKAAVYEWLNDEDGGGIEPEHLDALARFLKVRPVELVQDATAVWMRQFLAGGPATQPRR